MKLPMALNFLNDNATRGFLLHSNLIAHMGSDARWKVGGGGGAREILTIVTKDSCFAKLYCFEKLYCLSKSGGMAPRPPFVGGPARSLIIKRAD